MIKQLYALKSALDEGPDVRCEVDGKVVDVMSYGEDGMIVKIDGEEDGLSNMYYSIDEVEADLAKLLPYVPDAPCWRKVWQDEEEE